MYSPAMHVIAEAGSKLSSQMQWWFVPRKSVNVLYNTNKLKQKKNYDISNKCWKAFN